MPFLDQTDLLGCVRNSINTREDEDGYLSFLRFTDLQLQVYEPNPLYRLMSLCSSGVYLTLDTDAEEFTLECRTSEINARDLIQIKGEMSFGQVLHLLGDTLKKVNQAGSRLEIIQHFDLYVNDCYTCAVRLNSGLLKFPLNNPEHRWINVKIWLPLYKPVYLGCLSICGDWHWRPAEVRRPVLYAFGDSITQGFITGRPSFCYVAQLAELLGMDALNQGIGGALFDPHILDDLDHLPLPNLVTVAYGTNDWRNSSGIMTIQENTALFFARLNQLYSRLPIYVLTPIWRDDMDQPQAAGTFSEVTRLIRKTTEVYPDVRLIDGLSVSPHNPAFYADGYLHPNIYGFSYLAARLYREIAGPGV